MNIAQTAWALFEAHRTGAAPLTQKAGGFVGQIAVTPGNPLSEKQRRWLDQLAERADLTIDKEAEDV